MTTTTQRYRKRSRRPAGILHEDFSDMPVEATQGEISECLRGLGFPPTYFRGITEDCYEPIPAELPAIDRPDPERHVSDARPIDQHARGAYIRAQLAERERLQQAPFGHEDEVDLLAEDV